MSIDPSGENYEHRDGDHWPELEKAHMVPKTLGPPLASMRAAMQSIAEVTSPVTGRIHDHVSSIHMGIFERVKNLGQEIISIRRMQDITRDIQRNLQSQLAPLAEGLKRAILPQTSVISLRRSRRGK